MLVLEDHPAEAELLVRELRRAGFAPDWRRAGDEPDYLAGLNPDLDVILADYHLPQFDAERALRLMQERGLDIPFIVVSGTIGEDVAVSLMRSGATDYLMKDRLTRLGPAVGSALEQARLRRERQEADRRFRALIENGSDAIALVSADGAVLYASPSTRRVTGYDSTELVGRLVFDLVHPDDVEEQKRAYAALLQERGNPRRAEVRFRHRDGSWRWLELVRTNLLADPVVRAIVVNYRDVSERKRAEEEIRRRAAHLEALNAIITSAAAATDLSRTLETALDRTLEALGCERGEIWVGPLQVIRGLPREIIALIPMMEAAAADARGLLTVQDWRTASAPGLGTMAPAMMHLGSAPRSPSRSKRRPSSLGGW